MRRILASESDPERRLEELLAERGREIDAQAARLEQALHDLERREQALRDSRASLERLLRLGTSELEAREAEGAEQARELTAREARLREGEAELSRRREALGAVELKRAALERRERALAAREGELAARDGREGEATTPVPHVAFLPDSSGYRLQDLGSAALTRGQDVTLDGDAYVVARTGRSPLPGDDRRCVYLVRGPRERPSAGSS